MTPRTEAGRYFVNRSGPRTNRAERLRTVLAIEDEATRLAPLDVERWTWAEHIVDAHDGRNCAGIHWRGRVGDPERIQRIARVYAALAQPAADRGET